MWGDAWSSSYQTPAYIEAMIEKGALGAKTRSGIYLNKGKQVFSPAAGDYVDCRPVRLIKRERLGEEASGIKRLGFRPG